MLADFLPYAEMVAIEQVPDGLPQIRDHAGQKFLILAVVGQAVALVTGDADILEIKADFDTPPIMTVRLNLTALATYWLNLCIRSVK